MKRSATDYTGKALEKVARKMGYITVEGKRHVRVYDSDDRYVTTLPRGKIKKGTLVMRGSTSWANLPNSSRCISLQWYSSRPCCSRASWVGQEGTVMMTSPGFSSI